MPLFQPTPNPDPTRALLTYVAESVFHKHLARIREGGFIYGSREAEIVLHSLNTTNFPRVNYALVTPENFDVQLVIYRHVDGAKAEFGVLTSSEKGDIECTTVSPEEAISLIAEGWETNPIKASDILSQTILNVGFVAGGLLV